MECTQYAEIVQYMQTIREDIRFQRDFSWHIIEQQGRVIVDSVYHQSNMLKALNILKDLGEYEFTHPIKVAMIAVYIGTWLRMERSELFHLACAGLVADIGKAKVRDSLLNKVSELDENERMMLRQHPINGFSFLAKDKQIAGGVKMAVLCHHERHDGSGYPFGLKNDEIHLFARIIAVADIFDAMTSERIYSEKSSVFHAAKEIVEDGYCKLDPRISQTFFQKVCMYYVGSQVTLSNDMVGEIIHVNPLHPDRPLIRSGEVFLDLFNHRDIEIVDMV